MLVAGLANFVYLAVTETGNKTQMTLLGDFVNLQTNFMQVVIVIAAYIIGMTTIIDTMSSLLAIRKRKVGIYQAVGWDKKHIVRTLLAESAVWTGISVFIGSLVSIISFMLLYSTSLWSVVITAISFTGFYVLILISVYTVIKRFITKNISNSFELKRVKK